MAEQDGPMDEADLEEFRLIKKYDLTPHQAHILVSIEVRKERPSKVADRLRIGRPAVSEALRKAREKINKSAGDEPVGARG